MPTSPALSAAGAECLIASLTQDRTPSEPVASKLSALDSVLLGLQIISYVCTVFFVCSVLKCVWPHDWIPFQTGCMLRYCSGRNCMLVRGIVACLSIDAWHCKHSHPHTQHSDQNWALLGTGAFEISSVNRCQVQASSEATPSPSSPNQPPLRPSLLQSTHQLQLT